MKGTRGQKELTYPHGQSVLSGKALWHYTMTAENPAAHFNSERQTPTPLEITAAVRPRVSVQGPLRIMNRTDEKNTSALKYSGFLAFF